MAETKGSLEVLFTLSPMPGKPRDVPQRPPDHGPLPLTVSKRGTRPHSASIDSVANTSATAIPPRSRYGCWTCRQRKVKCDELRPSCSPCARLGHACDYNPRLVFRDDTRRVMKKMKNRGCTESLAWNGGLPDSVVLTMLIRGNSAFSVVEEISIQDADEDHLPPFSSLTNDEDREKKAEFRAPGTYNIIVNPSSFVDLEEYRESSFYSNRAPGWKISSLNQQNHQSNKTGISSIHSNEHLEEDPNVVILEKFEGDAVIMPAMNIRHPQSAASVVTSQSSSRQVSPRATLSPLFGETVPAQILLQIPPGKDDDSRLIAHFNRFVLPSFAQVHRDALGTEANTNTLLAHEVFAQNAAHFSPLYHALMALTALSMDNRGGVQNLDALQHYQKALPSLHDSLRTLEDLSSDHILLTHFVLLLYEIAASEPKGPNLRAQHLDQILRIIKLRNGTRKREVYSFIPWWVLVIDAHAVLTGGGDGLYAESLMRDNLLPETLPPAQSTALPPISSPGASQTSVLQFHRKVYIHATELGLLARNFRRQDAVTALRGNAFASDEMQQLAFQARESLQRTWETHYPDFKTQGYTNDQVPVKDRAIFEHTTILYSALIIYSYTSMWPSQTSTNPPPTFVETHAHSILSLSREIVTAGHLERKFVVFPLFMAGILFSSCFPSEFAAHRAETVRLLKDLEMKTMGKIANASRLLLELVYENVDRGKGTGTRLVDWVGLVKDKGLQVVNCRL